MRRLALLVALAVAVSACAVQGLEFFTDHRVKILVPHNRATVNVPVTLRWEAPGLQRDPTKGPFFAVFVDQAPIHPGQSLRSVADDACKRTPGCPDQQYLTDRYIFVTDQTSLQLDAVPNLRSSSKTGAKDQHEATIILLDDSGYRIGEAAYTVDFTVKHI